MDLLTAARKHLDHLVAMDTTSSRSNAGLTSWIADRLDGPGITIWDLPEPMTDARTGEVTEQHNLLVRIGPDAPGAIVLSAHTDCVPVVGQPWTSDPFTVTERDGRLHGRGTCDMKGFLATALAAAERVDSGALQTPIVLALSHSEEIGTLGAPSLAAALVKNIEAPRLAIVGEPTMMESIGAHKGVQGAWVTVTGVDAHSSQPQLAASATMAAARLLTHIDELASRHEHDGPHDDRFVPPMTTFNVGMIQGGSAINIVPRSCQFHFEFRPIPGVDADEVIEGLRQHAIEVVLPEIGRHVGPGHMDITITPDAHVHPMALEPGREADGFVRSCGAIGEPDQTVAYGTDGGWLQQAGLSVVVCGPGSIDQAHKADEFLSLEQFALGASFVERAVSTCVAKG